jgi:hypothetical protein
MLNERRLRVRLLKVETESGRTYTVVTALQHKDDPLLSQALALALPINERIKNVSDLNDESKPFIVLAEQGCVSWLA